VTECWQKWQQQIKQRHKPVRAQHKQVLGAKNFFKFDTQETVASVDVCNYD